MAAANSIPGFFADLGASLKSIVKIALGSRAARIRPTAREGASLIILGNGPSLNRTMEEQSAPLEANPLMAVNFAANAPQFDHLRPDYYILVDPVFFRDLTNANVARLWARVRNVSWPMDLFIPAGVTLPATLPANLTVIRFNPVGVEGFRFLENFAYSHGLGMPRPRNVLIPAIMVGIALGYKKIYLAGADHSWTRTLEVTDENVVVSVQPHFYEDNEAEHTRVASVYKDIRLHEIMLSFHIAFRSYFSIKRFASRQGCQIINSTPGSFIDAFTRAPLP